MGITAEGSKGNPGWASRTDVGSKERDCKNETRAILCVVALIFLLLFWNSFPTGFWSLEVLGKVKGSALCVCVAESHSLPRTGQWELLMHISSQISFQWCHVVALNWLQLDCSHQMFPFRALSSIGGPVVNLIPAHLWIKFQTPYQ